MNTCNNGNDMSTVKTHKKLEQGVYVHHVANPFIESGGAKMWKKNYLIMHNEDLRKRAGIAVLDMDITDMYKSMPWASLVPVTSRIY